MANPPRTLVLFFTVGASVLSSFVLGACGSDSDESTPSTAGTTSAAGNTGTAGSGGTTGGVGGTAGASGGTPGGSAGTAGGGGTGGSALMGAAPSDSTEAAITAYLQAETYKQAPWIAETAAPREATSVTSPHGRVKVWMNDTLVASQGAGNGALGGAAHTAGSMAVKEFYDEADMYLGRGVMLKVPGAAMNWVFYCESTAPESCGIDDPLPFYGDMNSFQCNGCHGGLIFNQAP